MKYAIVTGATKGIGLEIAKMLLIEKYFVTITYAHDETAAYKCAEILKCISNEFEILKVNQADKMEMKKFSELMCQKPSIDCIICNAGVTLRKNLLDIDDECWEQTMQVNVNSNVFLIRDLFNRIPNGSRIVFIASLMGIYPHGTSLAYAVSKSAIISLSKNLVKYFENTNTTVNTIAPGFVETEWQKDKPQEIRNNIIAKTAIKRFANPIEIANAVRFVINNGFVNGSVIEVSGGYCFK